MKSYSQRQYTHIKDRRTESQRLKQHEEVEKIVSNNIKAFNIELTSKKKVMYIPSERKKVDLGSGWYCYITDNQLLRRHAILTLHGSPGNHIEWAGLQTQTGGAYRWINLTLPGFDGQDERRGDYNGSCEHFSQLIIKLLSYLKVPKIILCAHSMGSIFSSYFITKYPQIVEGYINITGIVDDWYVGLLTFFQTTVAQHGYNTKQWRDKNRLDNDNHRAIMYNLFLKTAESRSFGPVKFPKLTPSQYFAYLKLLNSAPNGLSEFYYLNKRLPLLRVLIFGKIDPLYTWPVVEKSIYNLCRKPSSYINKPRFKKLFAMAQQKIEKRLKIQFDIDIDASRLQDYFCYHFEDTGHNAHRRRPKQIAQILSIYIVCLEILQDCQPLTLSKL